MSTSGTGDIVDAIRADHARLYPEVDTSGLDVTARILRLARRLEARREELLSRFGLTLADLDVLATVRRRGDGGMNPREVQASVLITSGGMTKRLDRLEEAGWLVRRPDPDDRRGVLVELTPAGRQLADEVLPVLFTDESTWLHELIPSARERDRLGARLRDLLVGLDRD